MSNIVYGKNPVEAAVNANHVKTLYVAERLKSDSFAIKLASQGAKVKYVSDMELEKLAQTKFTQGYVAEVDEYKFYSLSELINDAKNKQFPLIAMLDGIEDPHNLGAILRSADAFGVDGIIIKKKGQVPLNSTVAKVSTGAIEYVKVCEVANLSQAIKTLKDNGYWIVATDGLATQNYDDIDYKSPICVIIGSEGFGISQLVLRNSDFIVKIPMYGHVNSLNASNAACTLFAQIDHNRHH